jgi:hypothetical protein
VIATPAGKTRITIRIDDDVLDWFRKAVHRAGGGNYQTLMNEALRGHIEGEGEILEETLRRVLREELPRSAKVRRLATRKDGASKKTARAKARPRRAKGKKRRTRKAAKRKRA